MRKLFLLLSLPIVVLSLFFGQKAQTSSGGPPAGKTGGPGEGICTECHNNTRVPNSTDGSITITANPTNFTYTPGATIAMQAKLSNQTQAKYGFQVMAVDANGLSVGTFIAGTKQKVVSGATRKYLEHSATSATGVWDFQWRAPLAGTGTVTFYWVFYNGTSQGLRTSKIFNGSTVFTEFIPLPVIYDTISATICQGQKYSFNNLLLTTSGSYKDTLLAANGADSIVTLNLLVNRVTTATFNYEIKVGCPTGAFNWVRTPHLTAGTYIDTTRNLAGCDSIVTYNIIVTPQPTKTVSATICQGKKYRIGADNFDATGVYQSAIDGQQGDCDTIVTLFLTVTPASEISLTADLCSASRPYKFGSKNLTKGGTYVDTTATADGCDSITTLTLNYNPQRDTLSYTFHLGCTSGVTWPKLPHLATGVYYDTLVAVNGCDSIIMLNVTALPYYSNLVSTTICAGKSVTLGTKTYYNTGIYSDTVSANGCDTIQILNLTVTPAPTDTLIASICKGGSYSWRSKILSLAGTYSDTIRSVQSCDSIKVLVLNTTAPVPVLENKTICLGSSYLFGSRVLRSSGTYTDTSRTAAGCDSITTLSLLVNISTSDTLSVSVCKGQSYTWRNKSYTLAGTYYDTVSANQSCDTLKVLMLSHPAIIPVVINNTICFGKTFQFGSRTLSASGNYSDTSRTSVGCDSITNLTLTVSPQNVVSINRTICFGKTLQFGSRTLSASGNYADTARSVAGCDSITNLALTVSPQNVVSVNRTVCFGASLQFGSRTLSASGNYSDTTIASAGCDSITNLTLTVSPQNVVSVNRTICFGKTFQFGARSLSASGNYSDTSRSAAGCDSITNLSLTVSPQIGTTLSQTVCFGKTYQFGRRILAANGVYFDTARAVSGCDSIITLNFTVSPQIVNSISASKCRSNTYQFGTRILRTAGTYDDTTRSASGCDSITRLTLSDYVLVIPIITRGTGDTISVNVTGGTGFKWLLNGVPVIGANQPRLYPPSDGSYVVTFTDANGCTVASAAYNFSRIGIANFSGNMRAYPNPTKGYLIIENPTGVAANVRLYNGLGQVVYSTVVSEKSEQVNLPELPQGMYVLELGTGYRKQLVIK